MRWRNVLTGEQVAAAEPTGDAAGWLRAAVGKRSAGGLLTEARASLARIFLPEGYPASVSEDYLEFQAWDTLQALCSYFRGILATQALLQGVGVGEASATPLAAALQWVLRDGAGMVGSLSFGAWAGSRFDAECKTWRFFADAINDIGLTLELLSPLFPGAFLLVACVASICKAMCGVAAGATRSAITAHFARRNNLADISAKEGAQETAVTLMGLVFGMALAPVLNTNATTVWIAFALLTALHIVANYRAMRALHMVTVTEQRAVLLWRRWLVDGVGATDEGHLTDTDDGAATDAAPCAPVALVDAATDGDSAGASSGTGAALRRRSARLAASTTPGRAAAPAAGSATAPARSPRSKSLLPSAIAAVECFLPPPLLGWRSCVAFGVRADTLCSSEAEWRALVAAQQPWSDRHVLRCAPAPRHAGGGRGRVGVSLSESASPRDALLALIHAVAMNELLAARTRTRGRAADTVGEGDVAEAQAARAAWAQVQRHGDALLEELARCGWDTTRAVVRDAGWRWQP